MASPINSLEWWNDYFQAQWEQNDGRAQTRHFMAQLVEHLPAREHRWISSAKRTILDWGCALGDGVDILQAAFPSCEVSGLDFSPVALQKATASYPNYSFLLAENGAIPFDYDVIVTSNCLEHYSLPFELAGRHVERARYLYIMMVPFDEPHPVHESHVQRFTIDSFPEQIGDFRKLWLTVFRPSPRYWNAPQAIVGYAGPDYPGHEIE